MKNLVKSFKRNERGATMVEYAVVIGLICAVAIGAITVMGGNIRDTFQTLSGRLPSGSGGTGG